MPQLTSDRLEDLLTEYGWTFESTGENAWRTGFQGEQRLFPLCIRLTQTCISFEVRPLIDLVLDGVSSPLLSREMLELNDSLQLVKLAVSDLGEVSLVCQVLANGFNSDMLGRILGILGYYADEVAPEIYQRLADIGFYGRPTLLS